MSYFQDYKGRAIDDDGNDVFRGIYGLRKTKQKEH
jgi:hypothetical protein